MSKTKKPKIAPSLKTSAKVPTKKTVIRKKKPAAKSSRATQAKRSQKISEIPPLVEHPHHGPYQPSFWKIFLKATLLALFFAFIMLLVTALVVAAFAFRKLETFSSASQLSLLQLKDIAEKGWYGTPATIDGRKNFLLLGVDSLATRGDEPPLTDTMMFISLNMETGLVSTVTLPRDIWSPEYQTKINALYQFGLKKYPDRPEQLSAEVLSKLTGVSVQHTFVVSLDTVSEVIDMIGGVDVTVPDGFVDELFPRPDVDVTKIHDPKLLYQTVTFEPGEQHMNGERVLQYVRSRHSLGKTGTDNDRGARQQLVMQAMIAKLMSKETLSDLELDGKLLHFYMTHFDRNFPITELLSTAKALLPVRDKISLHPSIITVYPEDAKGVLIHPPETKYKQWVYEIKNLAQFQTEVQTDLNLATPSASPTPTTRLGK